MRFMFWLVLLGTLLLWSGNWIVARGVRDDIAPGLATAGRLVLVLAILLPFTWRGLRAKLPALSRLDWVLLATLGFTGGGPHMALQWLGMHYTTATSGILYLSVTPIFILLFALPLGERIGATQAIGVATSFAGIAVIATQGHLERLATLPFNIRDMLAPRPMVKVGADTVPPSPPPPRLLQCGHEHRTHRRGTPPWRTLSRRHLTARAPGGGGDLAGSRPNRRGARCSMPMLRCRTRSRTRRSRRRP
jgi:hypothetical protein